MSLQVRLRHSLGDRLIELSPRSADRPVLIGRMAGAEVQVPSAAVAPRHAMLFVHQGRWVVQDAGGGQTFVNGQPVAGATFLKVGDVVALGVDPKSPTVEIDPDGPADGRSGYALANGAAAPAAAMAATVAAVPQAAPVMTGGHPYGYATQRAAAVPAAQPEAESDPQPDGDSVAWPDDAPTTTSGRSYVRRKKQDQSGVLVAACLIGAVIVGVTIWVVVSREDTKPPSERKKVVSNTAVTPQVQPSPSRGQNKRHRPASIFDDGVVDGDNRPEPTVSSNAAEIGVSIGAGRKPTATVKAAAPNLGDTAPSAAAGAGDAEPSPSEEAEEILERKNDQRMKQTEWKAIITAYYSRNPLDALRLIDDYKTAHPGVLTEELHKLREGTLDRLWFERIDQLWSKREEMATRLRELDQALEDEPDETYRLSTIIPEKNSLQRKINAVTEQIEKEMGYTADKPPLITDEAHLAELRPLRDPEYYANWKASVINSVHRRGELPFAWEK